MVGIPYPYPSIETASELISVEAGYTNFFTLPGRQVRCSLESSVVFDLSGSVSLRQYISYAHFDVREVVVNIFPDYARVY